MKNRRRIAIIAITACLLMVPFALGISAARADELADLQANQELLKQRLDQLSQVGLSKPQEAPGTPTIAGSFPRSFLIPGTDTSIRVGGEINLTGVRWFSGGNNAEAGGGVQILGVPGASSAPLNYSVPGVFNTTKARSNNVFDFSIYASRLRVETQTPTPYGQAQTVLEFDFLGCSLGGFDCNNTVAGNDGLGARLRLAYGTLGNFAAGQMYSAATQDLSAYPETIDTGCCAGEFGTGRLPAVSYTLPLQEYGLLPSSLIVALVDPEDSMATPQGMTVTNNTNLVTAAGTTATTTNNGTVLNAGSNQALSVNPMKTDMPDIQMGLRFEQPWGHLQLESVVHDAPFQDGAFLNRNYIGYGGGFSGDVKPAWFNWTKDDIGFSFFAGNGIGRYAGGGGSGNYFPYLATNYGAPFGGTLASQTGNVCGYGHSSVAPTAACATNVLATLIPAFGGEVWYQHWWTPTIRSTAEFGLTHEDVPTSLVGTQSANGGFTAAGMSTGPANINKEIVDAHFNILWSPVSFVDTGFEYLWTHRQTIYNVKGDQNVAMYMFKTKF